MILHHVCVNWMAGYVVSSKGFYATRCLTRFFESSNASKRNGAKASLTSYNIYRHPFFKYGEKCVNYSVELLVDGIVT